MITQEQLVAGFVAEARELLESMEVGLLGLEYAESKHETVNAIFRAAHTVKGSAGLCGLEDLVAFAHVVESVLDELRSGRLGVSDDLVSLLLRSKDHLDAHVQEIAAGVLRLSPGLAHAGEPLLAELRRWLQPGTTPSPSERTLEPARSGVWHVSIRFGAEVMREGYDPIAFVRHLGTLGDIIGLQVIESDAWEDLDTDPTLCALGFELALRGSTDAAVIRDAFTLVRNECELRILPPDSPVAAFIQLVDELPEGADRLERAVAACGSVRYEDLLAARSAGRKGDVQTCFLFDELPDDPVEAARVARIASTPSASEPAPSPPTPAEPRPAAPRPQPPPPTAPPKPAAPPSSEPATLRVDAEKLDLLINLVGELAVASASGQLVAQRTRRPDMVEASSVIARLVEEVRDSALSLRMVKIGGIFGRFQRVVRDVAKELGKDIALELSGEDTELDKTVVERLGDPLMHLVRNSMDHGIEEASRRRAAGKPARGTVGLHAAHDSGSIVIEVRDDGGGLDRDRILAKAISRGLVEPGAALSEEQIHNLIFEPGFSTAETITNISGRGVGMDVVRRNIEAMRGSVSVRSELGVGTAVVIRLPLTLASIDGFMVSVGAGTYVIPLEMVEECIEYRADESAGYIDLRGEILPFIRLHELFGDRPASDRRPSVVVLRHGRQRAGLVVDGLLGELQTVIKPLGPVFRPARCISGSTILGSGEVGLVLDVAALLDGAQRSSTKGRPS